MHILGLPPEMLDHILYFGILSRRHSRAFRLKLVCKCFYTSFNRILFHTGLLDTWGCDKLFENWQTRRYHGADKLWHDYLLFNCRSSKPNGPLRRFREIRAAACALLEHFQDGPFDPDMDAILDKLCWLALHSGTKVSGMRPDEECRMMGPPPDTELNLLSAATFFGCEDLVRELLAQGHDPTAPSLFPSPMYVAAWNGQAGFLRLMQADLPEFEDLETPWYPAGFRSKIGPGSLEGAAARGDVDMARLALYPASRKSTDGARDKGGTCPRTGDPTLVLGERPGAVAPGSKLGCYISRAMEITWSPQVYEYLKAFLNPDLVTQHSKNMHLAAKATAGDAVMVWHLLEAGAEPTPRVTDMWGPPLLYAARAWHEDVIDLMLAYGADINERGGLRRGTILTIAARCGSMGLLRRLLAAGAVVDPYQDAFTLWRAILSENSEMVGMFLRMGINTETYRRAKVKFARDMGLESMVELLEPWVMGGGPQGPVVWMEFAQGDVVQR